jgi:cyclophilin family peptidyl-prolyl cis-trans isomerase
MPRNAVVMGYINPLMSQRTRLETLLLALTIAACSTRTTGTASGNDVRASVTQTYTTSPPDASFASPITDPCTAQIPAEDARDLLDLAFEDSVLNTARAQRCLTSLTNTEINPRRSARLFLLARRLPAQNTATLWDAVRIEERELVMRAVAGRARGGGPVRLPANWERTAPTDLLAATIGARFQQEHHATPTDAAEAVTGLGQASLDRQLATARWLRMVAWTPTADDLSTVSAYATPALVRSLADGPSSANVDWNEWVRFVARRARLAPRLWGNAWRALRDGLPKSQWTRRRPPPTAPSTQLTAAAQPEQTFAQGWAATLDALPRVRGLTGETLAWFECEDAAAIDTWLGRAERTAQCATGSERWIALALRARVLGKLTSNDAERARELTMIYREAQGRAQVLSEVATAVCTLPRGFAMPLLTTLSRERDAGVLAALIEGLVDHSELARALDASVRDALIRAPFEAPEAPTLEARIQAIKLAKLLHREELVAIAQSSSARAVQAAFASDGGLRAPEDGRIDRAGSNRVRFVTDAGNFEIELDFESAPVAAANLRAAARAHRYDGLRWHRVVPGFVVQGGDPRGDGYGGTDSIVRTELSLRAFDRGAVGVPLAGLDTGGMQLFIVIADAPHLDGRFPWVGRVVRGMDSVDGVLPGDRITRAELVE